MRKLQGEDASKTLETRTNRYNTENKQRWMDAGRRHETKENP